MRYSKRRLEHLIHPSTVNRILGVIATLTARRIVIAIVLSVQMTGSMRHWIKLFR